MLQRIIAFLTRRQLHEQLVLKNQALGRKVDALQAERILINQQAAKLRKEL